MTDGNGQKIQSKQPRGPKFMVPKEVVVLYADNIQITAKKFGVVLDVTQQIGPTDQHIVVSRVGLSRSHAKALCEQLLRLLQKSQEKPERVVIN